MTVNETRDQGIGCVHECMQYRLRVRANGADAFLGKGQPLWSLVRLCVCLFVCASVSVRICVRACMCACVRDVRSDKPSRRSTESCASRSNIHGF